MLEKLLVLFGQSKNTGAIDGRMYGSGLEEKSSFKMLGLTFSSKFDWGSYIISIAKSASKKIGALIRFIKFLSPEVALYLYKSTIWNCWISYKNEYAGLMILHLLHLLNTWLMVEMYPA